MAYRDFIDEDGVGWEVWEARPLLKDRRVLGDRRGTARGTPERRTLDVPTFGQARGSVRGWLVFRSATQRRRRSAIPDRWEELSDDGLRAALRNSPITAPRARYVE
jgi:hypothetical protein